jgi:Uncharacterized protein conserved in bacteria
MVLIQLNSLTLGELRLIALQEGIENSDTLDREALIEELEDLYEDDNPTNDALLGDVRKRFVNGLTDYRGNISAPEALPGVEELPQSYPDTSLNVLQKNASWLYCFWSISSFDREKLAQSHFSHSLMLSVIITRGDKKETFEVPVTEEDDQWNISVPNNGGTCQVSLVAYFSNDTKLELARSKTVDLVECYFLEHPEEIKADDGLFKIYLSLLTTKDGTFLNNSQLAEIVAAIQETEGLKCRK